jgi:histidinol-phosphate aminotransferase
MTDLIRKEIQAIKAYHVADPGKMIKLDAMENPYSIPSSLQDEWLELIRRAPLNRYPDPSARQLSVLLREVMGVPDDQAMILGNGSDELIQIMAMAIAQPGKKILAPEPCFVMYKMIATFTAMQYVGVPLRDDFSLDLPAMLDAIRREEPALIFLAYPNNPTGNLFDEDDIVQILEASSGLVVLDEAYHPFADSSFMSRLGEFDNLLVMRTVSKMGLAGLRLGLLAGPQKWLSEFDKVRLPYNINVLTQLTTSFALRHADVFAEQAARICEQRQWLFEQLQEFSQFEVFASRANFILLRVLQGDATGIFESMKQKGVLIKNMHPAGGALSQCLRLTVGTEEENKTMLAALAESLADSS